MKIALLLFPLIFLLTTACENSITSPGPQPYFLDNSKHTPMLNVFGVLRPDSLNGFPMSYIHLEQAYPVTPYPDSVEVSDATITIYSFDKASIDSIQLLYTDFNDAFSSKEYRHPHMPCHAEHSYSLECKRIGFPTLSGSTTVPMVPRIIDGSIHLNEDGVDFTLAFDPLAGLYDIYLFTESASWSIRVPRPDHGDIRVHIPTSGVVVSQGVLRIYAYDLNLSEYITFNVSVKPNTYSSDYSTVENGFGCFGSLNVAEVMIGQELDAGK
ncbi:DUF4249 family protein [candidate division KSB1 bacterium]|nr:DUF4249 family protein [candidate division KSB1 bacterium]